MFAGIIIHSGSQSPRNYVSPEVLVTALTPYDQADQVGVWEDQKSIIVHALTWNTVISKSETSPWICSHSGLVITSWARLDNRSDLAKNLSIDNLEFYTDPMLIVTAYRCWGEDCVSHLEGDFAFVIYDPKQNECFAARDSLGVKPFYYYLDDNVYIFSSTAAIFNYFRNLKLQPNISWMANYLVGTSDSNTETGLENILKLPPAHYSKIKAGHIEKQCFFNFKNDAPSIYHRDKKWVEAYRETLNLAVSSRVNSAFSIGSETSGGIDSSTIAALAALNLKERKKHFHLFGKARCEDEAHYILETSQFHRIPHNHIYTCVNPEENADDILEREIKLLGYPREHGISTGNMMFYRLCKQFDIRTLLSGFGGDEAVTNTGDLLLLELVDAKRYWALLQNQPGNFLKRVVRAGRYFKRSSGYQSPIEKAMHRQMPDIILNQGALEQYASERYLKRSAYDSKYRSINDFILGDRLSPSLSTRLENCTLMASSYGVEYRWPLLDRRLIQQYLSTPSIEKFGHQANRFLHRRSVADVLPNKIIWKTSKSMGSKAAVYGGVSHVEELKSNMQVPEDIHPSLELILDQKKVSELRKCNKGSKGSFIARRSIGTLNRLNKWLYLSNF